MKDFQSVIEELDTQRMIEVLDTREQMLVSVMPCVISTIVWEYVDKVLGQAGHYKVGLIKDFSKNIRELKIQHESIMGKELDLAHRVELTQETKRFMSIYQYDFIVLYYAVNGEFKKKMPSYPYDDMRSNAIIVMLMIQLLDEHNKEMDKLIRKRLGIRKNSIRVPLMDKLHYYMQSIAGVDGKFNFSEKNVVIAKNVIKNKLLSIDFQIGNVDVETQFNSKVFKRPF